jgi:hypothetical protein
MEVSAINDRFTIIDGVIYLGGRKVGEVHHAAREADKRALDRTLHQQVSR